MSAFNIVWTMAICPSCEQRVRIGIQFKYGDTWQHEYEVSQELRWGGNDIGEPGKKRVVLDGVAGTPCPSCTYDEEWNFYVIVENDRIVRVEPATGKYDFAKTGRTYIVLQE